MSQTIYRFGNVADGGKEDASLLGGKGANLAEMTKLGLDVPPGITVPTTVCQDYHALGDAAGRAMFLDVIVDDHILPAMTKIHDELGHWPLWSVRSGAEDSMPGMMDTLLNVGLTSENYGFWDKQIGELARLDCRRRLIAMFAEVIEGADCYMLNKWWKELPTYKYGFETAPGTHAACLQSTVHMNKVVDNYEGWYSKNIGHSMPDTLRDQIVMSVKAVFDSWGSERAVEYREMYGIPHNLGTAVNIQMMVFGNLDENSCSGVAFTRDPATGEPVLTGEFLVNAQGEDVVAGTATPLDMKEFGAWNSSLEEELGSIAVKLEGHYRDMMDLEFTVEDGKLWMLQCRVGKRSAKAAFRIVHDMVEDEQISKEEALSRVTIDQYKALKKVRIDLPSVPDADFTGIAAGGGLVVGTVVTDSEQAKKVGANHPVILVTDETTPEDFGGMTASVGILTRTGGATSHAAVVGRSLEKHCVVGCTGLPDLMGFPAKITIDGATGRVWLKELPLTDGGANLWAAKVVSWGLEINKDLTVKFMAGEEHIPYRGYAMGGMVPSGSFQKFLTDADTAEFDELYIDLSTSDEHELAEDAALWRLLGTDSTDDGKLSAATRAKMLATTSLLDGLKKKAVLIPSEHTTKSGRLALKAVGWNVVQRVETIEDLLDSDGIVDIDAGFAAKIGGEHVAEKMFTLMQEAGKTVRRKPVAVTKSRLVYEVLK